MKHDLSPQIFEKPIPNFTKIRPAVAHLFLADGQTDMTKLIVPFRNFANAPEPTLLHTTQRTSTFRINLTINMTFPGWSVRRTENLLALREEIN